MTHDQRILAEIKELQSLLDDAAFRYNEAVAEKQGSQSYMRAVVDRCASQHGVKAEDMMKPNRGKKDISRARMDAYRMIRDAKPYSLPKIASFFKRDHTTILSGIRRSREAQAAGGWDNLGGKS